MNMEFGPSTFLRVEWCDQLIINEIQISIQWCYWSHTELWITKAPCTKAYLYICDRPNTPETPHQAPLPWGTIDHWKGGRCLASSSKSRDILYKNLQCTFCLVQHHHWTWPDIKQFKICVINSVSPPRFQFTATISPLPASLYPDNTVKVESSAIAFLKLPISFHHWTGVGWKKNFCNVEWTSGLCVDTGVE